MIRRLTCIFILSLLIRTNDNSFGQRIDDHSVRINPRYSFYSFEKKGEILVHLPNSLLGFSLNVKIKSGDSEIITWKGTSREIILRIPFDIGLPRGEHMLTAEISSASGTKYLAETKLLILPPKTNEVKTDNYTGGLIVNRRIFFPFGFYCYSPVYPTLPEEEIVRGFNLISPYQKILPETFNDRKAYMDRCAMLGMKVHYNLLSVSGGGGVNSVIEGISDSRKREMLLDEIRAFMDHPALLAWYISDEPNGYKLPPELLEEIYNLVKATDPWHPVSIVFMAPFLSSRKYSDALDIVMADPYPVPNGSVNQVGDIAGQLRKEFNGKKPVWIVPQAFGGGEWWGREPSAQELRSMTYQALITGAGGIQYFVRHGPNSFPKSTAAWDECSRMALEIAEITPWLLSDETAPSVKALSGNIAVCSRLHDGQLLIAAVSRVNVPQRFEISVRGMTGNSAKVLFENRRVSISSGLLSDYLGAFGSQVYLINLKSDREAIQPYRGNMSKDPGFEDITSPGVPSACYAWNEGDRGATFFIDSREHFEGNHSLRLITPETGKGSRLRFFPVAIKTGCTYTISIRAKADTPAEDSERTGFNDPNKMVSDSNRPYFELGLGDFGKKGFYPGADWEEYVTSVTIPADSTLPARTNVILRMPGKGTAWFDMIQVFESADILRSINPELKPAWLFSR